MKCITVPKATSCQPLRTVYKVTNPKSNKSNNICDPKLVLRPFFFIN
jgi:hypothetical protein